MKRIILLTLCIIATATAFPANELSTENKRILKKLDGVVEKKEHYRAARVAKADSLKAIMQNSVKERRMGVIREVYHVYERFENDSALAIMNIARTLPEYDTDRDFRDYVNISTARTLAVMGIFNDAFQLLETVNPDEASAENRLLYYNVQHAANGWLADFAKVSAPELAKRCLEQEARFNDSIVKFESDPIYREIDRATLAYKNGEIETCIAIAEAVIDKGDPEHEIYVNAILAQAYGKFGNPEKEVLYLAKTAINDIENGISEYMALHLLACRLLQLGDTERAHNYIICAMEDAAHCGARLRTLEASEYFPIIDKGHKAELEHRKMLSNIVYITLCVLLVVLVLFLIYMRRQVVRHRLYRQALAKANRKLEETNAKLQLVNSGLVTSGNMREDYIIRYLSRCRGYLDSLDVFKNKLIKLALSHQWEELQKKLKTDDTLSDEKDRFFEDFDELFLNLYPDYIEKVNALLKPECRVELKKENAMSVELRIFALVKLGITDSGQIAKFLGYSIATIYNYRSRFKNNVADQSVDFEEKIMQI